MRIASTFAYVHQLCIACVRAQNRMNWGGGIELFILAKHYGREIAAWNIETAKSHVFGEEAGYAKQVSCATVQDCYCNGAVQVPEY